MSFNEYDKRTDATFVGEVEAAHKAFVDKKTAAAKKYGIPYAAAAEDPSPVIIDPQSRRKVIKDSSIGDPLIQQLANAKRAAEYTPFDVNDYLKKYPSAVVIQSFKPVQPTNGLISYMKDDKEPAKQDSRNPTYGMDSDNPGLTVLNGSLSKPFISNNSFDPLKGEIPVIIPYGSAEKLLGLKKLNAEATTKERLTRLEEIRHRIGEVTAQYCYRNNASQALLSRAQSQQEEIKLGASDKEYVKPALIYAPPNEKECGAITVTTDTRTAAQKKQDSQQVLFEKEMGTYIGEPEQHLITVRGVGISSEFNANGQGSVSDITQALLSSSLGYGTWTIPADLLSQVPAIKRPASVFESEGKSTPERAFYGYESYLVDFKDKEEARTLLKVSGAFSASVSNDVYAAPFGSGVLVVDELKTIFTNILMWVLAVVGGVAVIILASIIGRTVSEGRRESSIFRAIGASRLDIGSVYGMYVILLSLRVVLFTAVLSIGLALAVEILFWKEATLGAQLAYASTDTTKEFHLFALSSPYLLWIFATIIIAGILASIIPILLGARRNPIKDMRNEG